MTTDIELRKLAEAAKEWSNVTAIRKHEDADGVCVIGGEDEDGNFYPVIEIDCDQYYADSKPLATYIAAANPATILSLLDRLEKAEKDAQLTRIQKECLRIGEEIQRAAGYLPEFYELEVYVERGYGCVYLRNSDGEHTTFSDTVDGLSHCITQAIDAAMEATS